MHHLDSTTSTPMHICGGCDSICRAKLIQFFLPLPSVLTTYNLVLMTLRGVLKLRNLAATPALAKFPSAFHEHAFLSSSEVYPKALSPLGTFGQIVVHLTYYASSFLWPLSQWSCLLWPYVCWLAEIWDFIKIVTFKSNEAALEKLQQHCWVSDHSDLAEEGQTMSNGFIIIVRINVIYWSTHILAKETDMNAWQKTTPFFLQCQNASPSGGVNSEMRQIGTLSTGTTKPTLSFWRLSGEPPHHRQGCGLHGACA